MPQTTRLKQECHCAKMLKLPQLVMWLVLKLNNKILWCEGGVSSCNDCSWMWTVLFLVKRKHIQIIIPMRFKHFLCSRKIKPWIIKYVVSFPIQCITYWKCTSDHYLFSTALTATISVRRVPLLLPPSWRGVKNCKYWGEYGVMHYCKFSTVILPQQLRLFTITVLD